MRKIKVKLLSKRRRNIGRADLQPHKLFIFRLLWSTKQNRILLSSQPWN